MIKLWLDPRVSLYYPLGKSDDSFYKLKFHRGQGLIDLSHPAWAYHMLYGSSDIKVDAGLLNRGYEV